MISRHVTVSYETGSSTPNVDAFGVCPESVITIATIALVCGPIIVNAQPIYDQAYLLELSRSLVVPRFEDGISLRLLAWLVGLCVGPNPVVHDTALRSVCAVLAIASVFALTVSGTDRTTWLLSFLVFVTSGAGMLYVHIDLDVIDVVELKANS